MSTEKNLKNIIDLMRRDDSVDAPADSIRWANNLFRTRSAEPKRSLIKKIAAVLQTEIAPNKAVFGERSASASTIRQMLYRADENAIDLRIEQVGNGFDLSGQILGTGFEKATVVLTDDQKRYETEVADTGEFRFANVPAGRYALTARGSSIEISLKSIDIE
jgi:hypothetical protein